MLCWSWVNHVDQLQLAWKIKHRRPQRDFGSLDVKKLWDGALFGLAHGGGMGGDQLADLRPGVVEITGYDGMHGTHDNAGWLKTDVDSMRTVVTLRCRFGLRVDVDGVIRTGLQTRLASDAAVFVELHNPIVPLIHGGGWANTHARRIRAVIAARDLKAPARVGIGALLDRFHPGTIHSERNFVLTLARRGARVTSSA